MKNGEYQPRPNNTTIITRMFIRVYVEKSHRNKKTRVKIFNNSCKLYWITKPTVENLIEHYKK